MFATKMLIGALLAAGAVGFAAQPAKADRIPVSVGIGGGYRSPATVYCPPPARVVVAPRPVYVAPVYRPSPAYSLNFGWFGGHHHHRHRHHCR